MIKIAKLETSCEARYILQNIEALKNKSNQLDYLTDTLERCTVATTPTTKKKRALTNYNCFVKVMVKKGQSFKEVVKSKAWSTLSDKQKATWKDLAKEGCPPRLWQKKIGSLILSKETHEVFIYYRLLKLLVTKDYYSAQMRQLLTH